MAATELTKLERRKARHIAFQALYETDAVHHPVGAVVMRLAQRAACDAPIADAARQHVAGVWLRLTEIDDLIRLAAPTWPLMQMARIDKNILRLAIYDAFVDNAAVPARGAINDAIELAKTFGSDNSSKFVNGVLATLAERQPRPTTVRADHPE